MTDAAAERWRQYRVLADRADHFTRWMLERTLEVLSVPGIAAVAPQLAGAALASLQARLRAALGQSPVEPPQAIDPRLDLLVVLLTPAQTRAIADLFLPRWAGLLAAVPLDGMQQRRRNPWGGFREAWLEHYNQVSNTA